MDTGLATVIAATVTAGFAFLGVALSRFRKENHQDHAYVRGLLTMLYKSQNRIETKVDRVDERLDDHMEFHAEEGILDKRATVDQDGAEGNRNLSS
jgi:hypothetical protein